METGDKKQSLTDIAVNKLKHDIVTGFFMPEDRLNIETLKHRYEMGATPVREALNQLEAVGLVQSLRLKGFRVSSISKGDLVDIIDTRLLIEAHLIEQAIERNDDQWESEVVAAHHRLHKCEEALPYNDMEGVYTWMTRFCDFYSTLFCGCDSQHQKTIQSQLMDHTQRYCYLYLRDVSQFEVFQSHIGVEYHELMQAVIDYDVEASQIYINTILSNTKNLLLDNWDIMTSDQSKEVLHG